MHLSANQISSRPAEFEQRFGQSYGLACGISLYALTVLGSVVVVRLVIGRRLGDFRLVLVGPEIENSEDTGATGQLGKGH